MGDQQIQYLAARLDIYRREVDRLRQALQDAVTDMVQAREELTEWMERDARDA